jgi:hypothetical protein
VSVIAALVSAWDSPEPLGETLEVDSVQTFELNHERLFGAQMFAERAFRVKHPRVFG